MSLKLLVIKPTLACTSNCKTCHNRKELYKKLSNQKVLSLEEWKKIISDAKELGAKRLMISGGEPTLYKDLTKLITHGNEVGLKVSVNTNGSLITEEYARTLLDSGLDKIHISLYGHTAEINDKIRTKGLWEKTTNAIRICSKVGLTVTTQALVCKDNYKYIPELIKLHKECGSSSIRFSHLEGDFDKKYLPPDNDGVYRKTTRYCRIPREQALILANGDIHPCNVVEYSHKPIVGNLFRNNLKEIWYGEKWMDFRRDYFNKEKINYCKLCPMNLKWSVSLRR